MLLKARFSEGEPQAHSQNDTQLSQVGQFSALTSHFKPHIRVAAFVFQVPACTMRFTCCVMTDKWLTWDRQVGSGAELPGYLPCIPSEMFPLWRKQKALFVLLVARRKTFVMELDSSCGATTLLPKDWDVREGPCKTNTDRALIGCCLHSVACLQQKKELGFVSHAKDVFWYCSFFNEGLAVSPWAVVLSSGPKENSRRQQIYEQRHSLSPALQWNVTGNTFILGMKYNLQVRRSFKYMLNFFIQEFRLLYWVRMPSWTGH